MTLNDLGLKSLWMNAPGTLGYSPGRSWDWGAPQGAFVTNPISRAPRAPAGSRAALSYPGGVLLHSGHPNPGLRRCLRRHLPAWRRSALPVWVHLLANDPLEAREMARDLESLDGVAALEVGIPPDADLPLARSLARAALGELPLVVSLPLNLAAPGWLAALAAVGCAAIALAAPRGSLVDAGGSIISGRLYGAGLFPQVLQAVSAHRDLPVPLIAGAGVFSPADGEALLAAGAAALQVDTALWQPRVGV